VLVLDDLHWADPGTVGLLRHAARFAPRARLLLVGAYRDVEVHPHHPLSDALGTLPRETAYEEIALAGLDATAVRELVATVAEQEVQPSWAEALTREESGNRFSCVRCHATGGDHIGLRPRSRAVRESGRHTRRGRSGTTLGSADCRSRRGLLRAAAVSPVAYRSRSRSGGDR
jgi:hypothetical protein